MSEIVLYQPPGRPWGLPNMSPFCTKLETYLRIAQVPHKVEPADFRKAPKGKIPFVLLDDKLVGDSQLIINELEKRAGTGALDHGLSTHDAAIGHAAGRMLEEGYYFVGLHIRWAEDAGWAVMQPELKKMLPGPLKMLSGVVRRSNRKKLKFQGTGRHAPDEIVGLGAADFDAVSALLGDKPFLLGDTPRTADCAVFAFVDGLLGFPRDSPLRAHLQGKANLVAYHVRVRDRWFPDLDKPAPST